eukprot:11185102-Lingulodinium_polyedra.AAC.1
MSTQQISTSSSSSGSAHMASPLTHNTFNGIVASMKSITSIETAMAKKGFPDVSKALLVKLLLGEKLNISADASEFEV